MMVFEVNKTNLAKELLKKKKYINIFHNPATAWIILLTSLVLTVGAYFLSVSFVQQKVEDRFAFRTTEIESAIKDRLRIYEQALWGGVGLMNASKSVSRQEWAKYVESLKINEHWPGIQGMGFSIPLQPEEKQTHIEKIRSEGFPEYLIKPEGTRNLYSAIIYLEPFDWRNKRAFGYDMWSNEMRRIAMTYARDKGVAVNSGIITLVQETKEDIQKGFLMYLPVYQTKTIPKTLKERREQFMGWVYAPFRAGDLMKGIVGSEDPNIEFEIFDGEAMSQKTLLFNSSPRHHSNQPHQNHDFQKTARISLQGRPWTIQFNTHDTSSKNSEKNLPRLVALAGGFVDLLLFYVVYSLYFINRRAETIAKKMTKESRDANEKLIVINANLKKTTVSLKEKETLLQEIHHRVKNNMAVISSLLSLQAKNIEDSHVKDILKESQGRIYAMSAVHETLHGSEKLSEIDLKSYLSKIATSIFQTYSTNHQKVKLNNNVEEIPIDLNQAYPLGLTINELISNSLKYAFPDEREGEICVSIKKLDTELELTVMDNGVGIPKDLDWKNSKSLGLKLVRILVENQLDGSVEMENTNGTKFTIKFNIET